MGALLNFERSGLIRQLVPLAEGASAALQSFAETPALSMMAASASPVVRDDPNAGVTLVELHNDADRPALESQLAADPTIEEYSRVPIRYLLVKKAAARKTKKAPAKKKALPAAAIAPTVLWNLAKIRWAEARARTGFKDGSTIKVAVLDTGIDQNHPDLEGTIDEYLFAHPTLATASSNRDIVGHGTHVAGTIAAQINNNVGINGIAAGRIHAYKIFDDVPDWFALGGYFAYFAEPVMYRRALARCVSAGIDVVNLSIGGPGAPDFQEQQLFKALINKGVSVVAAMGNENSLKPSYPAAIPGVIAVGATSIDDSRAPFSNMGPHIALCAPGVGIWSTLPTYPGNMGYRAKNTFPPTPDMSRPIPRGVNYGAWDGTSMAAPHVTSAAALVLANKGMQSGAAVKQRLQKSAAKVPGMNGQNFTPEYGSGRLDLFQLLK
jgi:subtilisin family serine protease